MKRAIFVILFCTLLLSSLPSEEQKKTWYFLYGSGESELGAPYTTPENTYTDWAWSKIDGQLLVSDWQNKVWKILNGNNLEFYKERSWLTQDGQIVSFDETSFFLRGMNLYVAFLDKNNRDDLVCVTDYSRDYGMSLPILRYFKQPLAIFTHIADTSFSNEYFGLDFGATEVKALDSEETKKLAQRLGAKILNNWLIIDGVPLTNDLEAVISYWRSINKLPTTYYDNYRYDPPNSKNKPRNYIGFEIMKDAKVLLATKGQTAYYIYSFNGYFIGKLETDPNAAYSFFDDGSYMSMITNDEKQRYEATYHPNTFALWVNDDKVRIRDRPGTDGAIVTQVDKGTLLYSRNESRNRMQIGGVTAEWQKIMTEDGKDGWIFGAFVQREPIRK